MPRTKAEEPKKESKSDRQARWDAIWEEYKKTNPEKYALKTATEYTDIVNGVEVVKKKKDESKEIPDSFQ